MEIAFRIKAKEARLARQVQLNRDISQTEVARDLGVTRAMVSDIESGQRIPGVALLIKLCRYYGMSLDGMVEIEGDGK